MKFISSQLMYLIYDREMRANFRALVRHLLLLASLITFYSVLFHVIQAQVEGKSHSWVTGLYWTLVVMTTLGFGDITFTTDLGRLFSIIVLLSGVILLLIVLSFQFIRLFYAPWLEARVRLRAPRELPEQTSGHVIIAEYDALAAALVERLATDDVPYVIIEPDPAKASRMLGEDIRVVLGENDSRATYEKVRAASARLIVANCEDPANTNVALTVREVAPRVPIAALVESDDAAAILELTGANWTLPLKRRLGESLATRADTGRPTAHVIGRWGSLQIAELPARGTSLANVRVRDTRFRERNGVSVVGLWQRGLLRLRIPTLAEGVRLFSVAVPPSLAGKTLGESRIGSATGLSVVAIEQQGTLTVPLTVETSLPANGELIMLGNLAQRQAFSASVRRRLIAAAAAGGLLRLTS
jgi:voltage-gated potassium channel